ncbi:MAG TPA: serine/threonine-protein kinase [Propionibacteriaceae bacterium]|nr:serine/threonine-protein kinase [Propionibacteriaceae bacterium]
MDAGMLLAGRYRLDRPIGAGGMGHVWAAHDTRLGRDVALKVQQFDPAGDRVAFERFQREAQSAAGLQHPNVVTIFDSGTEGETAFLVMELLPGPTLEAYVAERGPLSEREAIALAAAVASGLSAAHRAGVVHRDIKPTNLMFDARGGLKIVDFGIARLAQTAAARLTATKTVIGSAPYLSPEQLTGRPAEERSDLYALGCVMTTMLTGRPPFEGEHPLALLNQHVNAVPPQLSERRPGIDPALEALVAQLLSKSPQDRPQSALAVLDRLRDVELGSAAEHSGVSLATTAVLAQATRPLPAAATTVTAPALPDRPESRQGWWIAGGAAVLALLSVLLIGIASMTSERPATESALSPSHEPASPTSSASATRSAKPSRTPASTSSASETMTTARTTAATVQGALSDLRAAVAAVSSNGEIDGKEADELSKRVDELAKHLTEKDGKDAGKHVDDMEKYLRELSKKGELTASGERRLAAALQAVRERAADG